MSNKWLRSLWIGALLAGLPILGVVGLTTRSQLWWLTTFPPMPQEAMQVQTLLLRDYTSVIDGLQRETTFEIDQPEAAVQEFYRRELAKQGWIYRGAERQQCGAHLKPSRRMRDVYDRDGRSLAVDIFTQDLTERREVQVVAYQGRLRDPSPQTPVSSPGPREILIGDWQAIDEATGRTFVLCAHEQGGIALVMPEMIHAITGKYQWIDANIRLTFDTSSPVELTDPAGSNDRGRCVEMPALLVSGCRSRLVDPAAYPGPDGAIRPRPTQGPPPSRAPYPAPLPPITEYLHIEEQFAVNVEQNTLTLTGASGVVQTFHRVMQE